MRVMRVWSGCGNRPEKARSPRPEAGAGKRENAALALHKKQQQAERTHIGVGLYPTDPVSAINRRGDRIE
jgi:hypothetical protein